MNGFKSVRILLFVLMVLVTLSGCSERGVNNPPDNSGDNNQPPRIMSISISPTSLPMGQQATLSCNAYDADGDSLSYRWTADAGSFPGGNQNQTTKWQAPDVPGQHNIKITVRDSKDSVYQQLSLTVLAYHAATIRGDVTTGFDDPLPGVNVCFGVYCTKSDFRGHYQLLSIPSGSYQVEVSLIGYKTLSGSIEIKIGLNELDFQLEPIDSPLP